MNVSAPFIRRPVATSLLALAVLLAGLMAYGRLPVAMLPDIDLPTIQVSAALPGASPETMAAIVAIPLERRLGAIAGVSGMTSVNTSGNTEIVVQFELSRDMDSVVRDVRAAIDATMSDLPADMPEPPRFRRSNPAAAPLLMLAVSSGQLPIDEVHHHAERVIAQRLSRIPGVGNVTIAGAGRPAVRIAADADRMAAAGIGWEEIRATIAGAVAARPNGSVDAGARAWIIDTDGRHLDAEGFGRSIVAWRDGAAVRLADVAHVEEGVTDTRTAGWFDRRRAVLLILQREPGANLVRTVDLVRAALPELRQWIPPSVEVAVAADRTGTIRAALSEMHWTFAAATVLVLIVNALFLTRLSAILISVAAIPVSLAGTFAVMWTLGYTLDSLTLTALALSIGFIVDDAIIMTENMTRETERGATPAEAALAGSRQIGFTIVSLTASLVAALIPVIFMDGMVGRFFRVFGITLSAAVLVSALVSLTLTPMLYARRLGGPAPSGGWRAASAAALDGVCRRYARGLDRVLAHPRLSMAALLAAVPVVAALYAIVPKGFIPPQDTGIISGITEASHDLSFGTMAERQRAVAAAVQEDPAVASVGSFLNATLGGTSGGLSITLKPPGLRTESTAQVMARLRDRLARFPGISTYLGQASDLGVGARLGKAQFQATLQDRDRDELHRWAPKVLERLRMVPGLSDVSGDPFGQGVQTRVVIDRASAARLGIDVRIIDQTLYDAFGQRQVAAMHTATDQVRVVLTSDPGRRVPSSVLESITFSGRGGTQVPLSAFARLTTEVSSPTVFRQDQTPAVTVSFNVETGTALNQALARMRAAIADLHPPPGLTLSFQGEAKALHRSEISTPVLAVTAVLAVYILLGMLYESLRHPLVIVSCLPIAGLGGLAAVLVTGTELSIIAMIGLVLLVGMSMKNAILIVDLALQTQRGSGTAAGAAIREACMQRFRPVVMTTLAALFGILPLALGTGTGSELRQPLGIVIVGGLALSQLLTLYMVPAMYVLLSPRGTS